MRLVIDSNVWISALVFGGVPRQVLEKAVQDGYIIVVSEELLSETRRILHAKFSDFAEDFEDLVVALTGRLLYVRLGRLPVEASRDPDDNMVIETALTGDAMYVVSGDKDLLVLKIYESVKIVTAADFLKTAK